MTRQLCRKRHGKTWWTRAGHADIMIWMPAQSPCINCERYASGHGHNDCLGCERLQAMLGPMRGQRECPVSRKGQHGWDISKISSCRDYNDTLSDTIIYRRQIAILAGITPRQRLILGGYYIMGMTPTQLATALNISRQAVHKTLARFGQ